MKSKTSIIITILSIIVLACCNDFIEICRYFGGNNYATWGIGFFAFLFFIACCLLLAVKADVKTETYYKNNFTPLQAFTLSLMIIVSLAALITATVSQDTEGKIKQILFNHQQISSTVKDKNNVTEKNNIASTDNTDTDELLYRD